MMKFLSNVNAAHGIVIKQQYGAVNQNPFMFDWGDEYAHPESEQFNRVYENLPIVYRCLNIRANNISMLPIKAVRRDREGKEVDISDMFPLVTKKPNPFQTRLDFWAESSLRLDSQGELFWNLDRNRQGQIVGIYADWRSEEIEILPDPQTLYRGFVRTVNGKEITLLPSDVFYVKYIDLNNPLRGLSPIRAAKNNVVLQLNSYAFLKKFYEQGMSLGGVFTTEAGLAPDTKTRIAKDLRQYHEGLQNMHRFMVVDNGLKFQPLNKMSLHDAEMTALMDLDKEEIANVYGIPPEIASLGNRTYENLATAMVYLWEQTLIPHNAAILAQINDYLVPVLAAGSRFDNVSIEFDYSKVPALQEDMEHKARVYDIGVRAGAISRNEMRQDVFKKDPIEDESFDVPGAAPAPATEPLQESEPPAPKAFKAFTTSELDSYWHKKIKEIETHEEALRSGLVSYFDRQEAEVLERVEAEFADDLKGKAQKEFEMIDLIFNMQQWVEDLKNVGSPLIIAAITAAAEEWISEGVFNATDPAVRFAMGERVRLFSTRPNEKTRIEIQRVIREGFEAGDDIEGLKNRIKKVFSQAKDYRAQLIARTEAVGASNFGTQKGLEQGGWPYKTWVTSRDKRVRCSHKIDGQTVPVTSKFQLQSDCDDGSSGRQMDFPMDYNERCIMRGARTING